MKHSYNRRLIRTAFIALLSLISYVSLSVTGYGMTATELDLYQVGSSRPVITSLSPESAMAGDVVELIVLGANFESNVSSFAISGSGIRVLRTVVISQFQLRVMISIDPAALPGLRNIRIINSPPGGGSSATVAFRVKPPPHPEPLLLRMSPSSAQQGETIVTELSGRSFVPGQSFVILNGEDGIRMDSVTVIDANTISVKLIIDELAQPGHRNLSVVTPGPGGGTSQDRAFMVQTAPYPLPTSMAYYGEPLVRGSSSYVEVDAKGLRSVTRVMVPDAVRMTEMVLNPPNSLHFQVDIPSDYRLPTMPVVLSNPRPGGGISDTLHIPVVRPRNIPPQVERVLSQQRLAVGESQTISLGFPNPIFIDVDGDTLTYRVSINEQAVFAEIRDDQLYIRGNIEGRSQVTLIASDGESDAIIQFPVSVFVPIPNRAPTLNSITSFEIPASSARREVSLNGITAGAGENQRLTISATSSNTRLIPNPEIEYSSPNATGSLSIRPNAGVTGTATITVRVRDNGGTDYNGVDLVTRTFTITVRNTEIAESDDEIPGRFRMDQNYPNPFNPTTTIDYTIGETAFVRLSVFDVTGRPVQRLVEREQAAGTYSVTFTADKIPSGMYIYRLEAGSYTQTRTMLLVK